MDKNTQQGVKPADDYMKYFRATLLAAIVAAAIYLIISNLTAVGNIIVVLLGFGAVILIHEFGHFIMAKLADINVEAFSIGFPPTLLGIQRTEKGTRLRILPRTVQAQAGDNPENPDNPEKSENDQPELIEEAAAEFTVGKPKKPGETEYRIGLIPFGGFVKMLGQEDMGQAEASSDPRSYSNKSVKARASVIAAGVIFNAISAILIFMIVFLIGVKLTPPTVGSTVPGSPAEQAGIQPGDRVVQINGKSGHLDFSSLMLAGALASDDPVALTVERDGSRQTFNVKAEQLPGQSLKGFGIQPVFTTEIADLDRTATKTLLERTDLKPGDIITHVGQTQVSTMHQLDQAVADVYDKNAPITVQRDQQSLQMHLPLAFTFDLNRTETENRLSEHIHSMIPLIKIEYADHDRTQMRKGDVIIKIADFNYPTYLDIRKAVENSVGQPVNMTVLRDADDNGPAQTDIQVTPRKAGDRVVIGFTPAYDMHRPIVAYTVETEDVPQLDIPPGALITEIDSRPVETWFDVIQAISQAPGQITLQYAYADQTESITFTTAPREKALTLNAAVRELIPFDNMREVYRANNPVTAVGMGLRQAQTIILSTYSSLVAMIAGRIGADALSGPVGIVGASYNVVAGRPLIEFVYWMGIISVAIAVFNFLPMAPLDGGLFVLLIVEKIKGSPLSVRIQTIILYAGWILILALFLFVTFHDIMDLIRGWLS